MALLPALIQQIQPNTATGLALPLIFARGLGQLCGPRLLKVNRLEQYAASNRYLLYCLLAFLAAYCLLPGLSIWTTAALVMIFLAHLASNVVFALGTFSLLHAFPEESVSLCRQRKSVALAGDECGSGNADSGVFIRKMGSSASVIQCIVYGTGDGRADLLPIVTMKGVHWQTPVHIFMRVYRHIHGFYQIRVWQTGTAE
ncbi:MAG: transporter [Proteobacteria bacterium]|nr:transporter [Pseudomonadota bacterium]